MEPDAEWASEVASLQDAELITYMIRDLRRAPERIRLAARADTVVQTQGQRSYGHVGHR